MKTDREGSLDAEIESWIRAARSGSSESLGSLLQTFRQYLAIIAEHGLKGDLQAKVGRSDLVQETFLEAQRDFASFRGKSREQLEAWLRRLLLNNLLNARRKYRETKKRATGREVPLDGGPDSARLYVPSADTSPSQRAVRNEEADRLEQALNKLPPHYREIIVLRNHQRLSFVEIGRRLDRSPDNARMLWSRAFECLAIAVEQLR
jgi:RNA polymerase sigma-70 factor (ECF subfamily)